MYQEDTIAAVATPMGEGGVAIVRVSGPDAERIARAIFARSGGRNGRLRTHTLHYGTICEPKTGEVLDEVLLTLMRKPRSYTGEEDRKSTRLNSSHSQISYAVFCLKK